MSIMRHYFLWPAILTGLGLLLAAWLGFEMAGGASGALSYFLIGAVLAVLEISLSFDNAIVNANKLKTMTPLWQRRFLTWGIVIAVFGMRLIFPLLIVVVAAGLGPIEALKLAATRPEDYAAIIEGAHLSIAAFGGAFLMMVGLRFFLDQSKDVDWIDWVEPWMRRIGLVRGMEVAPVVALMLIVASLQPAAHKAEFLFAALSGLMTFLAVEALGLVLDGLGKGARGVVAGGLGAFLYLEVLDASFSFDGVIGAFALTQNLFLIAIGLGIGALYVRALTVMMVERRTLAHLRYLENGAFWSILVLAVIMFAQTLVHVPEVVTGLLGAGFIGLSLISSIRAGVEGT